jgi:hypothetical protein
MARSVARGNSGQQLHEQLHELQAQHHALEPHTADVHERQEEEQEARPVKRPKPEPAD